MAMPVKLEIVWDKSEEEAVVDTLRKGEGDDGRRKFDWADELI